MGIAVRPDGTIEVETVEQAIELSKRLAGVTKMNGAHKPTSHGEPPKVGGDRQPWDIFMGLARRKPARLAALNIIRERGSVSLEDLRVALGMKTNNEVGGVMAGISKNMKTAHMKFAQVINKDMEGRRPDVRITYHAGPLLRTAPGKCVFVDFSDAPDKESDRG